MRMDIVPYNNDSVLTEFHPVLKKNFEELFSNGEIGLSSLTLQDIYPMKHYTEKEVLYGYSYSFRIPYAGKRLVWEVKFNPEDMSFAPDFNFNDENFTLLDNMDEIDEHLPSLINWNVRDAKCLSTVLKELVVLYKKQQIKILEQDNMYAQLKTEYQTLTEEVSPHDVEFSLENTCAHFLINIKVDTSSLPEYLQTQDEQILNPGSDVCVLKVSFLKLDTTRVKNSLQLSPRLDQILGSQNLILPSYTKASSLLDYLNLVNKLLEDVVKRVAERHKLRKEFVTGLGVMYPEKIVEFDTDTFCKGTVFCEVENFECLVQIELGELFPDEQPTVTLLSLYCLSLKKPCSEVIQNYPYSPRWSPEKKLEKLMENLTMAVHKFKNHKH